MLRHTWLSPVISWIHNRSTSVRAAVTSVLQACWQQAADSCIRLQIAALSASAVSESICINTSRAVHSCIVSAESGEVEGSL